MSALKSPLALGKRRRCSIKYCVRVVRLVNGMVELNPIKESIENLGVYGLDIGQVNLPQVREALGRASEIVV